MIFLKKNKILIVVFILLLCWGTSCFIQRKQELNDSEISFYETVERCKNSNEKWCDSYRDEKIEKPDTFQVYFYTMAHFSINYIQWLAPLFVISATVWLWHRKLHSGFIKDELLRSNYKKVIIRNLLSSAKACFILPLVFGILFVFAFLISGHFNVANPTDSIVNVEFLDNIPKLIVVYFVVLFLHSILYACIGLIFCKKNRNVLITIVSSYLCFLALEIISEVFVGGFLLMILGLQKYSSTFNLLGIWIYCDYPSLDLLLIYSIVLALLGMAGVFFVYKDKEEVLLKIEKQN